MPEADRPGVIACLTRSITEQYQNHHHTGNTGTTCLIDILPDLGQGELMWKILNNKTYPGWGFMVDQDATTVWESWSLVAPCGSVESMIMWATIDEFFYHDLAGIRGPDYYGPAVMAAGFKRIRIAPFVPKDLDAAQGSIRTAYGTVASRWRKTSAGIELRVEIPANTTAQVGVPKLGRTSVAVTEGGKTLWKNGAYLGRVDGIGAATEDGELVTFAVGSGSYTFEMKGILDGR